MNYRKGLLIIVTCFLFLLQTGYCQQQQPYEGVTGWQETKDKRMQWFREARFGLFIHWGLYAVAGGSWNGRDNPEHYAEQIQRNETIPSKIYAATLKPAFTATAFNADEWASLAKEAGMKYVVITSKHHDGFTLFNSKAPFSIDNPVTGGSNISPKGRDLYGEMVDAFKNKGLKVGAYYSLWDWQNPDSYDGFALNPKPEGYQADHEKYKTYLYEHVKELANNYPAFDIFWPDFSSPWNQGEAWSSKRLLTDLIQWRPDIVINNRLWNGIENKYGDFSTPEKYVPPTGLPGVDWEVSHTMNESYGYSAHDKNWKSSDKMMRLFLETVSKGGNFLLNVGPDGEGAFPEQAKKILKDIGKWMKINSTSVYGTSASPFQSLIWGYCTQEPGRLYLHVFDIPSNGKIDLRLRSAVKKIYPLHNPKQKLKVTNNLLGKTIQLPRFYTGPQPIVIVVEIKGKTDITTSIISPQADGRVILTANEAKLNGKGIKLIGATTSDPNRPNAIGGWADVEDEVYWDMKVKRKGLYKLIVHYLPAQNKTGKIAIFVGDRNLEYTFGSGGGPGFQDAEMGVIEITQQMLRQESIRLTLKAVITGSEQLPEISNIFLVPNK